MARKIFFSFHYEDVKSFRVNVVRNSWVVNKNQQASFFDGSLWESVKLKGENALKSLIDNIGLKNTSVTAILIGAETHSRRWVRYEILKSFEKGNGIFGVYINRIKGKDGRIQAKGVNPLDKLGFKIDGDGSKIYFYELDNGKWNLNLDIPSINNKKSNTIYFPQRFLGNKSWGNFYKFSDVFPTYCWDKDTGYYNFSSWVKKAKKIEL
jgi:hypothetical protein